MTEEEDRKLARRLSGQSDYTFSHDPTNTLPTPYQSGRLKPCPFCGSTEIHTYEPTVYEIGNDASVNCENPTCGAEVRGCTLKEAIAKWNRRA